MQSALPPLNKSAAGKFASVAFKDSLTLPAAPRHAMSTESWPPEVDYKKVIRKMAPLLWPENLHLKFRVVLCGLTILIARVANLMVPQMYKGAIDTLTGSDTSEPGTL
eukprot:3552231-Rhodomonas_salina.1